MDISVVIPVYNEGEGLYELDRRLKAVLESLVATYEIIYVDDGSADNSWQVLNELLRKHSHIRLIRFVRNFGQHAAICAGFAHANGEYIVLMDCDLQDEPEVIPRLYAAIREKKVHLVHVKRKNRKTGWLRQRIARLFYRILAWGSGLRFDPEIGSFRIISRFALEVFNGLPEQKKYIAGIFAWMNLSEEVINVEHAARYQGDSTYSFRASFSLAEQAFFAFSIGKIQKLFYLGLGIIVMGICMLAACLVLGERVSGNGVVISVIVLMGGTILSSFGLLGGFLNQVLRQVQNRPTYIIEQHINRE